MALCVRRLRGLPWRSGVRGAAGRVREGSRLRDIGLHPVLSHCPRSSAPLRRPLPVPLRTTNVSSRVKPGDAKLFPLTGGRDKVLKQLHDSLAQARGHRFPPQQLAPPTTCSTPENVYTAGGESWHLSSAQLDCFRSLFEPGICRTPYQALPVPDTQKGVLAFRPSIKAESSPSPGSNRPDIEQQLALVHAKLREDLPNFFLKNMDYSIYRKDVEFVNSILHIRTRGLVLYQLLLTISRFLFMSYFSNSRLSVLKLTCHPETCSVQARWSVSGLPLHTLLFHFYQTDKTELYKIYDVHSTFYLASDGRISLHKMERVMPSDPLTLPKKTLLTAALVAIGFGEDRPALNFLSSPKASHKL